MQILRNRNIANTVWNIGDTFLYPVLFFGSTSFFIHKLGAAQFGIWMLINTIVVSMQLFNFGVGSNVFRNIAYHAATHNDAGKRQVMNNAISVTMVLYVVSVILAAMLAYMVRYHGFLHVEPAFRDLCVKGILLAGMIVGFKFFEQVFTSYFKAVEKYNKAMVLSTGNRLLALVLNIALLAVSGLSVLHLLLTIICVNLVFLAFAVWLLYNDFPEFRFTFSLRFPRKDASFALFTWLQSLVIILTFQADRYFVVDHFGLEVLTYYAIVATIFNHIYMLFNAVFAWIATKLTRLHAQQKDTAPLFLAARNMIAIGSSAALLTMFLLYPFVFRIILGAETAIRVSEYTRYFIVFELFFVFNIVPNYYFIATGNERKYFFITAVFAVVAVSSMFLFLKIFNEPLSVLYGLILSCSLSVLFQNMMLNRLMYQKVQLGRAVAAILPPVLISWFIVSDVNPGHWLALVLSFPAVYFIYIRGNPNKFKLLFRA